MISSVPMDPLPSLTFKLSSTKMGLRLRAEMPGEEKAKIDRVFSNVFYIPGHIDEALEDIADYMRGSFAENFDEQGRPKWDALSPAYAAYRRAEGLGDVILNITGVLRDEVTTKSGSGHVEEITESGKTTTLIMGGSSLKFRTHQQGASGHRGQVFAASAKALRWYGPKGEVHFADSVGPADFTIPARPMVDVQDDDRDQITKILRDFIYERLDV